MKFPPGTVVRRGRAKGIILDVLTKPDGKVLCLVKWKGEPPEWEASEALARA